MKFGIISLRFFTNTVNRKVRYKFFRIHAIYIPLNNYSCYNPKMKLPLLTILAFASKSSAFFVAPASKISSNSQVLNAVSRKDSYDITVLPGDGIGPEITTATKEVR